MRVGSRYSVRLYSLGTSFSSVWCLGGDGEAGPVSSQRNKVLHPRSRDGGAGSGTIVRYVRSVSSKSIRLGPWRIRTGALGCLLSLLRALAATTSFVEGEGMAVGVLVVRWKDHGFFLGVVRRQVMVLDQVGVGCTPGRCATVDWIFPFLRTGYYCGSNQSYGETAFYLVFGCAFLPSSVVAGTNDGVRRRTVTASSEGPRDFFAVFFFIRVLCASWVGHLPLLCPSRVYLYVPMYVLVFSTS